jgi:hypothetical protein
MKTLWCKNQENPSDRISHAWAPLNYVMVGYVVDGLAKLAGLGAKLAELGG